MRALESERGAAAGPVRVGGPAQGAPSSRARGVQARLGGLPSRLHGPSYRVAGCLWPSTTRMAAESHGDGVKWACVENDTLCATSACT